jgi:hypothetical protein
MLTRVAVGLALSVWPGRCAAADDVDAALQRLAQAIEAQDARAIGQLYAGEGSRGADQLWRRWSNVFAAYDGLDAEVEVLLRGVAGARALVRCVCTVTGHIAQQPDGPRYLVYAETVDTPLEKHGTQWLLAPAEWQRPDAERGMARLLASAGALPENTIVHMVLRMRAGIWWPVRHLVWAGDLGATGTVGMGTGALDAIADVLDQRHAAKEPGALHIFLPRQGEHWGAVQDVWHGAPERAESEQQLRAQAVRVRAAFGDADEHVGLADLLLDAGWHRLAVEEYEKARALDPSVNTGGRWERAVQALRREQQLREWNERLNAQRAAELAVEGGRLAQQDRAPVSARKPPEFLVSDYALVRHHAVEPTLTDAMAALEEAHREAVTVFGFPMEPVSVSIFPTRQEYQAFRHWRGETTVPEWSGGTSGIDGILTYSHAGVAKSIAHEYGHAAVHQFARDARVPVWLDEGIAVIMEGSFADHALLTAELYRRRRGAFFPIGELSGAWSRLPGNMARYAYAQARGMVEFLLARWGRERVLGILRDLRRGATYDEAFVRNVGVSQSGFEQEWARYAVTQMPRRGRRGTGPGTASSESAAGRGG